MAEIQALPEGILLVGLGPGHPDQVTRQAWQVLELADKIFLRTRHHPVVDSFPPDFRLVSFDDIYDRAHDFEAVYAEIVEAIMHQAEQARTVVYAVPGHPLVAEATGPEILRRGRLQGIEVKVIAGMSFLESVYSALGQDPFPQTTLVDAFDLGRGQVPPFPVDRPALVAQIHSRQIASEVKLTLMSLYPDEHPVRLVHAAGTKGEVIEDIPLYAIDRSPHTGLLTTLFLPPLSPQTSFESLHEVMARLRAPDGCPWDREQTHLSLRPFLLEEAYEVLDALDREDTEKLVEELGDLLFQVMFHAVIAAEEGSFNLADVHRGIGEKLIRRHPHVFGEVEVSGVGEVLKNWDRIKAEERGENGEERASVLDGVPKAQPALSQSAALQRRAARAGFDWPVVDGVFDKIVEELNELRIAETTTECSDELGDLLFALSHLANWYGIDPEDALRSTNLRFRRRFGYVETKIAETGKDLAEFPLDVLNEFWDEAKKAES